MAFDKSAYDQQYMKEHITRKLIPFNLDKPEDKALLDYLNSRDNITQYIKSLIRADMGKGTKMTEVINKNGAKVNFEAAVQLMDDEIREKVHSEGYETEQEFFTAYEAEHEKAFGEEWELSKEKPVY